MSAEYRPRFLLLASTDSAVTVHTLDMFVKSPCPARCAQWVSVWHARALSSRPLTHGSGSAQHQHCSLTSAHGESCFSSWCSVKNPLRAALQAGWGTSAPHTPAGAPQCGSHLCPPGRSGRNTVCLLRTPGGCAHALGAALEPVSIPERVLPPLPQAPGGGQPARRLCPALMPGSYARL